MRITESQLRRIIRQEVHALRESSTANSHDASRGMTSTHPKKRYSRTELEAAEVIVDVFAGEVVPDRDRRYEEAMQTLGELFSGDKAFEQEELQEVTELLTIAGMYEKDAKEYALIILRNWSDVGGAQP